MITGEPFARGRENKETRLRQMTLAEVRSTSVTIRIGGFMAPILNAVTQSYIRRMPYTLVSVHLLGLAKKRRFSRTLTARRRITQRMKPVRKRFLSMRAAVGRRYYPNRLLTLREREVLGWLARGKSNAEIGAILGISSATVSKHLEHIYPKLGVENRTAAASFASEVSRNMQ